MIKNKMKYFTCHQCGEDFNSVSRKRYCSTCILKRASLQKGSSSTRARMIRNREFIRKYKSDKSCEKCGYNRFPSILVFHHVDKNSKYKEVNKLSKSLSNLDTIKKEIEKCRLLCPNCHFEIHLERNGGKKNG